MAPIKIAAIVLKKNNFRETSVILSLYSQQMGKVRCVLKGVRTHNSRVPPLTFTPGSLIYGFYYMRRSELGLLSSPVLVNAHDIQKRKNLVVWYIILNLVNLFTPEREKEEKLFSLLKDAGRLLSLLDTPEILFVGFKIKLVEILGYGVELNRCIICGQQDRTYLFSGKSGGLVCANCRRKDIDPVRISPNVITVMKHLKKTDFLKIGMIKKIPMDILSSINFYMNITLNYHTGLNKIWWVDEKDILSNNH